MSDIQASTPPAEEMRRWLLERIDQADRLKLHQERHAYIECLAHMEWIPGVIVRAPEELSREQVIPVFYCQCCGRPMLPGSPDDGAFCWTCGLYPCDNISECDEPRHRADNNYSVNLESE
jgi:hypothetical protein